MLRFSLLGSGSAGNALLVCSSRGKILIDNGLSFRQLKARTDRIGATLDGLRAVFVTHEHRDHVNGLGTLARRLDVPVYVTESTYAYLPPSIGKLPQVEHFVPGDTIALDDMTLHSFAVTHDAVDPVSFVVESHGCRLGTAMDLGKVTALVRNRLAGSHALILESNYCPRMLQDSRYPWSVRQRIHGTHGHLSNDEMNALLKGLLHDDLQLVVAVHISQENNTPELAESRARTTLRNHAADLFVSSQDEPTPLFEIAPPTRAASSIQAQEIA